MNLTGEAAEQAAVVDYLRRRGVLFWHTPNEGNLPPHYRQKLGILGVLPGVPDLLIYDGRLIAVEIKAKGGRASPAQLQFIQTLTAFGGIGRICYGREEAIQWLETLNLVPKSRAGARSL